MRKVFGGDKKTPYNLYGCNLMRTVSPLPIDLI